jgi:hypothetical protein
MGLGLPKAGDGGDFITYVKYNAKAGRWYTKPEAGGDEYEVQQVTAVVDIENIKTGLMKFMAGSAPEYHFDSSVGAQDAEVPDGGAKFKRGFQVLMYAEKSWQGVREFSATAGVVNESMNKLYDAWESAPEKAQGQLPVVSCTGVAPVESKHGTNYQPILQIVGWTDRPAALQANAAPQAAQPAPAAAPQAAVPPPAPPAADPATGGSHF